MRDTSLGVDCVQNYNIYLEYANLILKFSPLWAKLHNFCQFVALKRKKINQDLCI